METVRPKLKVLKKRRSSLFASIKREVSFSQSHEEDQREFPFSQDSSVKPWTSMDNLDAPDEKQEDHSPPKPRLPNIVSVNVGGKVFHIPKHLALRHPKTRIGVLALCDNPVKRLTLCDDYNVINNEFFFDRDPMFFHYIFHFYCSNVLWVMDSLCPVNFEEEMSFWGLNLRDSPRCAWLCTHCVCCLCLGLSLFVLNIREALNSLFSVASGVVVFYMRRN